MTKQTPSAEIEKQQTIDKMTSDTLLGSLMLLVRQELAAAQKPWQAMSEQEQADAIHRIEMSLRQAVTKAVKIIASQDRPTASATLDKFESKDGLKLVLTLPKDSAAKHDLLDAEGTTVLIVLASPEAHMGGSDDVQPDPQQRALIGEGGATAH